MEWALAPESERGVLDDDVDVFMPSVPWGYDPTAARASARFTLRAVGVNPVDPLTCH
mgnify:CR=1 FL=1